MITNHRLDTADYVPTVHTSGTIKPELIVVHDTTHWIQKFPHKSSIVHYLKRNSRKVSYHIVIERDGTVVQMAPFNKRCHHAGRSSYKGRKWCNGFSIGIGMVNPGPLSGTIDRAKAYFNQFYTEGVVRKKSPNHGNSSLWLQYTPEQIEALNSLVAALRDEYGELPVTGHYVVSPGRKVDPVPMLSFASLGTEEPEEIEPEEPAEKVLAKSSRKYKANAGLKHVMGGSAAAGVGLEISKAAGVQNITMVKSYLDTIGGFVTAYGVTMLIAACVGGWLVTEAIQHWSKEDYDDGRYEPSAEADTP